MPHDRRRFRITSRTFERIRFVRPSAGAESETAGNIRSVTMAMVIAAALLAVFNSIELRGFVRDLPGNAATDTLVAAADRWHVLMLELGPAHMRPAVRDTFFCDPLRALVAFFTAQPLFVHNIAAFAVYLRGSGEFASST
jgi:hypothetical protein